MKYLIASILVNTLAMTTFAADKPVREHSSFNEGWRFHKDEVVGDHQPTVSEFDDHDWRQLNLPHDWGIEGPFQQALPGDTGKRPCWGIGWYRKHFSVPVADRGRRVFLDFDGAMSHAQVWLNGVSLGGWPYGYSSFRIDLTPHLRFGGDNFLAVRLDNAEGSSRWYPGAGIYRNVWLEKTAPVHVAHWGTFITTPEVSADAATVHVQVQVENQSDSEAQITVNTEVYVEHGLSVRSEASLLLPAGKTFPVESVLRVENPQLWSLEHPQLYTAVTTLTVAGKMVDRYESPFGIREIQFTADRGFLLNGQRVQFKGVCQHHDLGALGAALNVRALERQVEMLQAMGCNAIRSSHNPPAPELLDLCDRRGVLVIVEAFDCWAMGKTVNDYHTLFTEWHERDLRAMIRRDRNHPCVILWSTGNEIPEQGDPRGHALSVELTRIAHDEDPTRMVMAGCNHIEAGFNGFQKTVDVFGYNYKPDQYLRFREANPGIPLLGSETSSCVSSRGEYMFPVLDEKDQGRANFQVSSYDLYAPEWAMPPDREFQGLDDNPSVAGEFVWTGFDYLGEPTPYNPDLTNLLNANDPEERARLQAELDRLGRLDVPSRSSYFGIIDLAGFPKDRFYLYQARWRPDLPMAHLLPHWNWPERVGEVTPVHVYTSGDEAELFLNGKSLGRKPRTGYRLRWDDVIYQPGELKVVTWKSGQPWAEATTHTTGEAVKVNLNADRRELRADGADLAFVTVAISDSAGVTVPRAGDRVRFAVNGPAEIVAVDNGNPTDHESFQATDRRAFNGLCLVVIRTRRGETGEITLEARAEGLTPAQITLRARIPDNTGVLVPTHGAECWAIEQMPGGTTRIENGEIEIRDQGGCTVWLREELIAPVDIRYEAMVVDGGEPGERVSDLNCFWMATDPSAPGGLLRAGHERNGAFATYDSLLTYYVGYGGNDNTTTRFRRYDGTGARPLRPEHDLSDRRYLLESNRWYQIAITAKNGVASFSRDGETLFTFPDPEFLSRGWFGFRTVASHLRIRNLQVVTGFGGTPIDP